MFKRSDLVAGTLYQCCLSHRTVLVYKVEQADVYGDPTKKSLIVHARGWNPVTGQYDDFTVLDYQLQFIPLNKRTNEM